MEIPLIPFEDRTNELELMMGKLAGTFSSKGGLLLIKGEAGSGKTRLIMEFSRMAIQSGCLVLTSRCPATFSISQWPIREIIVDYNEKSEWLFRKSKENHTDLNRMYVEPITYLSGDPKQLDDYVIFIKFGNFLEKIIQWRPLVLIIEDLHNADHFTVHLVHYLVRRFIRERLLVLGTYREEDLVNDSSQVINTFTDTLRTMRREGLVQDLELPPLTPDVSIRILEGVFNGHVNAELSAIICQEAEGNPLMLTEIPDRLLKTGQVSYNGLEWKAVQDIIIDPPDSIKSSINNRLARLQPRELGIVEAGVIQGVEFDAQIIAEILSISLKDVLESLRDTSIKTMLVIINGSEYRVVNRRSHQIIYQNMPLIKRRGLHRNVADLLITKGVPNNLGAIAYHLFHSNDPNGCLDYSMRAGERMFSNEEWKKGIEYYEMAAVVLQKKNNEKELLSMVFELMGDGYGHLHKVERMIECYESSLRFDDDERRRVLIQIKCAKNILDRYGKNDGYDYNIKCRQILEDASSSTYIDDEERKNVDSLLHSIPDD